MARTQAQVRRSFAIRASQKAKAEQTTPTTATPVEGEVVKMPKTFVLGTVAPFDAMIGWDEHSSGTATNGNAFSTLKGVTFAVDGVDYTRTVMAYGQASELVEAAIAAGATTLEVQLSPNRNTMKITGIVVDGDFVTIEDDREQKLAA